MKSNRFARSGNWCRPLLAAATVAMAMAAVPAAAESDYFPNSNVPRLADVKIPDNLARWLGIATTEATKVEYRREMDALHLTKLRTNRDARNPDAPNAANYDPAKADPYSRPSEVLRMEGGAMTTSAEVWWAARRPEVVAAFEREIYGRIPAETPAVTWEVVSTKAETVGGVKAVTKELVGHVDNSAYPAIKVDIAMTETLPANVKGRVPVILAFDGKLPPGMDKLIRMPEVPPGFKSVGFYNGPDGRTQLLKLGWGYASVDASTIQADNAGDLTKGIIGLVNKGQPRKMDDWGALRAWAWGASRALDYLESDPHVAADEVSITGHSRAGKAAIVAMAFDQRFAVGFISSSGAGGAKLLRRDYGETLEDLTAINEFHWMAGNFLKYAADPLTANDLPADGDALIALCAPRPVFISGGDPTQGEGWVDPPGMFRGAVGAGPVYALLGKAPMETDQFPPLGTALIKGDIGFREHTYGHSSGQGPNWATFVKFAQKYFRIENEK